jgi:hypothetical protein
VNSGEGGTANPGGQLSLYQSVSLDSCAFCVLCPLLFPPFLFPTHSGSTLPDLTRPSSAFPTTAARRACLSLLRAHGRALQQQQQQQQHQQQAQTFIYRTAAYSRLP